MQQISHTSSRAWRINGPRGLSPSVCIILPTRNQRA
jgi:hypothetical protein